MCFISFVPVRAICDMIGMGISSSVLIQIRSEGSATWDLVATDKPFGCTMKTAHPDTGMGNITTKLGQILDPVSNPNPSYYCFDL